ncbi:hypothetical protein SNE40_022618 [Patella caerulea]|uniref:BHLH domain-containing protein n=1 Tax=Patella caerulea TaxID=87958 RepID=A0AAN8FWQ9_PATCE
MFANTYATEIPATSADWSTDMSSYLTELIPTVSYPDPTPTNMYNETNHFDSMNFFPEQVMGMNVHSVSPSFSEMSSDKSDSGCYSDDSNSMSGGWGSQSYGACNQMQDSFDQGFAMSFGQYPSSSGSITQAPAPKKRRRRKQTPVQRGAANLRERKRMFYLNDAFDDLKKSLPKKDNKSRLSRIDTLKTAIDYIQSLSELLKIV